MKFTIAATALFMSIVSIVSAQKDAGVYFTNPILGVVWNVGTPQSITWTSTNSNATQIDTLELRHGNASNLELVQTISPTPIPLSLGKFDWMVPTTLNTDNSYALVAKNAQGISYSAYFTIIGLLPGANATASVSIATANPIDTSTNTLPATSSHVSVPTF